MKKPSISNILVPVDFSLLSALAVESAQRLAHRFGGAIHLVHVQEFHYPAGFIPPGSAVPVAPITYYEDATRRVSANLRELAQAFGLLEANCYISNDTPVFDAICRVAQKIRADLIVTPTHGRTWLKHVFLGSTAERVIQHAPCPVLVDRRSLGKIDMILVPVDFSDCSLQALKYAIQFADRAAAKIIVFHAVDPGYAFTADGYGMYDMSVLTEAARKSAEDEMRAFVRKAKFGAVKFKVLVQVGPPVTEISSVAEEKNVDLIITATHGRTGFEHLLMGSVAEQMVRYANRPVLVVPSHPEVRVKKLSRQPVRLRRPGPLRQPMKQTPVESERLTKRFRKITAQPFPERRKTNKFRESHQAR